MNDINVFKSRLKICKHLSHHQLLKMENAIGHSLTFEIIGT